MKANPNEAIKLSMLAGEIMLANGAETYRVEDTMKRILINCGYNDCESFVTTTGVFACVNSNEGTATLVRRVNSRQNDFEKVALVNEISRAFASGDITPEQASTKLIAASQTKLSSPFLRIFASGIASAAFSYMFGASFADCLNTFFTGLVLQIFLIGLQQNNVSVALSNILGGGIISFISLTLINLGIGEQIDKIIIGALMPLLPGLLITNAIRDVLGGDFLSGVTRTVDALCVAVSVAAGVGVVLKIWIYHFGGVLI